MSNVTENRTVTVNEARSRVMRCFNAQRPVFLWGPPGVGKSDLVGQLTKDLGGHMIDLRLSQMEPTDLRGIPFYNKDLGKMDWAEPIDLPDAELASKYPIITLFLDEMNSAVPAVQAAAYQLILNRRLGKYVLPNNVVIVAAGNRESDKGNAFRMPTPLANRFVHLEVRVDFDSWVEWAVNNRVHKDVVGYIGFSKNDLMDFDPRSSSRSFATPRSWSFVSEFLYDEDITEDELTDLISGTIGEGLGNKFKGHRKVAGQMPNPADILSGAVKELKCKEISAMYSLTISMCYELKDALDRLTKENKVDDWNVMVDNFFEFMMSEFTTELVVLGARTALTTYKLPLQPGKLKSFAKFHQRFGKYILSASGSDK